MYEKYSGKPTFFMPLSVSVDVKGIKKDRTYFNLASDIFIFLYIFDFNSFVSRKNPQAAINGFISAFDKNNEKVCLILKVMNSNISNKNWIIFEKICKLDKRIILINKKMNRNEILALINVCDVYISPHRAEGFARTIAEALLLNKKVIATGYSGSNIFQKYKNYKPIKYTLIPVKKIEYHFITEQDAADWAEPDVDSISLLMRECVNENSINPYTNSESNFFDPAKNAFLLNKRLIDINEKLRKFNIYTQ